MIQRPTALIRLLASDNWLHYGIHSKIMRELLKDARKYDFCFVRNHLHVLCQVSFGCKLQLNVHAIWVVNANERRIVHQVAKAKMNSIVKWND